MSCPRNWNRNESTEQPSADDKSWGQSLDDVFGTREFNSLQNKLMEKFDKFDRVWDESNVPISFPFFGGWSQTSDPKTLRAYPVPSVTTYERCVKTGGTSAWNEDGMWRCLFPNGLPLSQLDSKGRPLEQTNGSTENKGSNWFTDYSQYLEFKRKMMDNIRQQRAQEEKTRRERFRNRNRNRSSAEGNADSLSAGNSEDRWSTWSNNTSADQDKQITSSSVETTIFTNEKGDLETKRIEKITYSDGTSKVKETTGSEPFRNAFDTSSTYEAITDGRPGDSNDGKGWFWK